MKEYKLLFKMVLSYLIKHGKDDGFIKQHMNLLKIFSCEDEIVSRAMSVYYDVDIDINRLISDEIIKEEIRIIKSIERTQLIMDGWCPAD